MEAIDSIIGIINPYLRRFIRAYDQSNFQFGLQFNCLNTIICFIEAGQPNHYFDFRESPIKVGGIYYIPTHHNYLLPYHADTKFIAYSFPWFCNPSFSKWALELKYAPEKFICKTALKPLEFDGDSTDELKQLQWFLRRIDVPEYNEVKEYWLFKKAYKFLDFIYAQKLHYEMCCVSDFAKAINLCERDFQKMCKEVFHCSPHEIIRHHLLNSMAHEILQFPYRKLKDIAFEFRFENESGFTRYFKNGLKITPSDMRKMIPPHFLRY